MAVHPRDAGRRHDAPVFTPTELIADHFGDGQLPRARRTAASPQLCLPSTKMVLGSPSGAFLDGGARQP